MAFDRREYMRRWREENKEHIRQYSKDWYDKNGAEYFPRWRAENPERVKMAFARWYAANFEEMKIKKRYMRYGVSREQYKEMHSQQEGVCAICGKEEWVVVKGSRCTLSIDHCHKTGTIRGLLCKRCNLLLGRFDDNPVLFERAAKYLLDGKERAKARKKGLAG